MSIDGAADLRAVQVSLSVSGGDRGPLMLGEMVVNDGRSDFLFACRDAVTGIDPARARLGVSPVFGFWSSPPTREVVRVDVLPLDQRVHEPAGVADVVAAGVAGFALDDQVAVESRLAVYPK